MRLFGYYAFHTFVNQVRKLLKTWVLIFILVCALVGGLIGFGAGVLMDSVDDSVSSESMIEEDWEEYTEETEFDISEDAEDDFTTETEEGSISSALGVLANLSFDQIIELIAGLIILGLIVFEVMSADKNGSKIFLPADVNLLFPSPMKPQSVLMFRLMTQVGLILISTIYLAFQLPNLVLNTGMSLWSGIGILVAWFLAILIAKLLNILCYTITATDPSTKKYLRNGVYAVLIAIVAGCLCYSRITGIAYLEGVVAFLNHPVTRWIPLWGWLKWFCVKVALGDAAGAALFMALTLAAVGVLVYIIWSLKADFYEDAMAKSEYTAQVMEAQQSAQSNGIIRRKKDRSDKLRRDGMRHGYGASVFFHKAMYNRFRFAHLGIFTKTTETYLVAALIVNLFVKYLIGADGYLPAVFVVGIFVFFRTLGNPLQEDTSKDFFRMIPESAFAKLFWSILGGTVNCLLDILPAMIVTAAFNPNQIGLVFAWIPVILTLDFYGTNVGTFINLSIPESVGKIVKQMVQAMFIYFGLIPPAIILIVGMLDDQLAFAAVVAALVCIAIGFLFLAMTPRFLEYREKEYHPERSFTDDELKTARRTFSLIGISFVVFMVVSSVLQILFINVLPMDTSWGMWIATFAPMYVIGVPVCLLVMRTVPKAEIPENWKTARLTAVQMVKAALITIFMMYAGNIIGVLVNFAIQGIMGPSQDAGIMTYATDDSVLLKFLFLVILAPLIEELLFRKALIDRIRPYGERLAIVTSALMFGLFHGNFTQLFYATGIGLVCAYIYTKTGKLRYSAGIHMGLNFLGSIVAPWILENAGLDEMISLASEDPAALEGMTSFGEILTPGYYLYLGYVLLMVGAAIAGLVVLLLESEKIDFSATELELHGKKRITIAWGNIGMILFVISCTALIVVTII